MEKATRTSKGIGEFYENKVPIFVQTNGDLLNEKKLETLLKLGVNRIDITSLDRFHKFQGSRENHLRDLFHKAGMVHADQYQEGSNQVTFTMWGATEDLWLGGNWARGRALENNLYLNNPEHNFCEIWSGAKDFLNPESGRQEIHIQLATLYPCCPTTSIALGDARLKPIQELLTQASEEATWQVLNQGKIEELGSHRGLSKDYIQSRIHELGNVCLWCDEYFEKHHKVSAENIIPSPS